MQFSYYFSVLSTTLLQYIAHLRHSEVEVFKTDLKNWYLPSLVNESDFYLDFKMNLQSYKSNMDVISDFEPTLNTWLEIDRLTWMNASTHVNCYIWNMKIRIQRTFKWNSSIITKFMFSSTTDKILWPKWRANTPNSLKDIRFSLLQQTTSILVFHCSV